jgi:hypothetical protein
MNQNRLQNENHTRMVTRRELENALNVTTMTIFLWRKMDPPLPCRIVIKGEKHRVFFPVVSVKDWLEKYRPHLAPRIGVINGSANNHGTRLPGIDAECAA